MRPLMVMAMWLPMMNKIRKLSEYKLKREMLISETKKELNKTTAIGAL